MSLPNFDDPKSLLERANKHLAELADQISDVSKATQIHQFVDRDGPYYVVKARLIGKIPDELSVVAKDVISNLRDALDHAVYASAVTINGGEPKGHGRTQCVGHRERHQAR